MPRKGNLTANPTPPALPRSENTREDAWRSSLRPWAISVLLLVLIAAAYWPVSGQDFTLWDDMDNIVENPDFNPPRFQGILRYWHPKNTARGLYAPATYTLWGVAALVPGRGVGTPPESPLNPHAFHLANLLIHVLSAWAVFMLLRGVLRPIAADEKTSDWAACAGALLFALHPVQIESVAWVSGTKDVLCGLFSIVAIRQYLGYLDALRAEDKLRTWPRVWHPRYLAATAAFLLAMFAKPTGVAAPLAAGGIAFFALNRPFRQVVLDLLPLLVLAGVFILFNRSAQQRGQVNLIPFAARPFIAGDAISFYLYKLFIPVNFCIHYGRTPQYWYAQDWKYLTGMLPYALAAGVLAVMWLAKSARDPLRWLLAGAAVFVAGMLPVLGLVGFMFQRLSTVADHYLYLPVLGPALVLARLLAGKRRIGHWVVAVGWLCLLGVLAFFQVAKWKDSETLFRHTVAANPRSWVGYNNLSKLERDKGHYEEAAELCRKALKFNPEYAHAHTNLGLALIDMDRLEEGMAHLNEARRLDPRMDRFFGTAAGTVYISGTVYEKNGDLAQAIARYRKALDMEPESFDARFRLGVCLKNSNQFEQAEIQFAEALKLKPDDARTHLNMGIVSKTRNKVEQAIEHYQEAIRLNPAYAHAYNNLGFIFEERGDLAQAVAHYEKAVEHAPNMAQARANLQRVKEKKMKSGL